LIFAGGIGLTAFSLGRTMLRLRFLAPMLERAMRNHAAVDERVLEFIATVPEAKRALAWAAAKQSYLQTARTLGYNEHDAQEWASEIIFRLQVAFIIRKAA
jgi:hypothetical protein